MSFYSSKCWGLVFKTAKSPLYTTESFSLMNRSGPRFQVYLYRLNYEYRETNVINSCKSDSLRVEEKQVSEGLQDQVIAEKWGNLPPCCAICPGLSTLVHGDNRDTRSEPDEQFREGAVWDQWRLCVWADPGVLILHQVSDAGLGIAVVCTFQTAGQNLYAQGSAENLFFLCSCGCEHRT